MKHRAWRRSSATLVSSHRSPNNTPCRRSLRGPRLASCQASLQMPRDKCSPYCPWLPPPACVTCSKPPVLSGPATLLGHRRLAWAPFYVTPPAGTFTVRNVDRGDICVRITASACVRVRAYCLHTHVVSSCPGARTLCTCVHACVRTAGVLCSELTVWKVHPRTSSPRGIGSAAVPPAQGAAGFLPYSPAALGSQRGGGLLAPHPPRLALSPLQVSALMVGGSMSHQAARAGSRVLALGPGPPTPEQGPFSHPGYPPPQQLREQHVS